MTGEEFKAVLSRHKIAIIAVGGGAIVVVILLIRRAQSNSSSGQQATLETLHEDLVQIDFDVNQIDTNLDSWGPTPTSPVTTGTPPASAPPTTTSPPSTTKSPPPPKTKTTAAPVPAVKPPVSKKPPAPTSKVKTPTKVPAGVLNYHAREEAGQGLGGYISSHADQWAVVDSWSLVGEEDYRTLYDAIASELTYGYPGDLNNWVRLN